MERAESKANPAIHAIGTATGLLPNEHAHLPAALTVADWDRRARRPNFTQTGRQKIPQNTKSKHRVHYLQQNFHTEARKNAVQQLKVWCKAWCALLVCTSRGKWTLARKTVAYGT